MAGATTDDRMLGGRVSLRQPAKGYRAGLDAALLAAACDAGPGERVLEVGCGVGGALLSAAVRRPEASFTGLERDTAALELAAQNIAANGLTDRVTALRGDVAAPFARLGLKAFDAVLANPPFFDDANALRGPHPAKAAAWMADDGLGAWAAYLCKAVRQGGTVTVIHRADRLADLLTALSARCGAIQVRPIHPFAEAPAKRVLVRAIKSGKTPLKLLPPLVLHDQSSAKHTAAVEAILRGEADLPWTDR